MNYPSFRYLIFLIGGIMLAKVLPEGVWIYANLCVLCIVGFIIFIKTNKFLLVRPFIPLVFFLLGILAQKINTHRPAHISKFQNAEAYLVNIESATDIKAKSFKTIAEVNAVKINGKWMQATGKTLLYFMKNTNAFPAFGEIYLIKGSPRLIEAPKNPFEFDYKRYQERKNILTHQFLYPDQFVKVGKKHFHFIFEWANSLSLYTISVFKKYMTSAADLGVAEAIVAGISSVIDQETFQSYSDTGAIHILSVSGGHVGILFLVLNFFLSKVLNRKKPPIHLILISLLWVYALFTGLSPSVCRATLMFSLFQIGNFLNRDQNSINVLGFSAIFLLLIQPNWIYDVGFQLSNLAVLGILILYPRWVHLVEIKSKIIKNLWEVSVMATAATVFTFPLSIYYFHQFPNLFLLSNPFVSFLAFFIVPIGILLIFVGNVPYLGETVGFIFSNLVKYLNKSILFFQSLPFSVTKGLEISLFTVFAFYVLIILGMAFFQNPKLKYLKYATLIVLAMSFHKFYKLFWQNKQHELTFHYIPNESGLSIVSGRNAKFIAQDSSITDPLVYQYHLKNYYDHCGIVNYNPISLENKSEIFLNFGTLNLQWLNYDANTKPNPTANYIMVSHNALRSLDDLLQFKGKIILDGSNKKWLVQKLKAEAEDYHLNLISLYETGSQTVNY